jgi:hypothetical protein
MKLVKLKDYKLAKAFTEDSKSFLRVLDLSIRGLTPYQHYKPIASALNSLSDNKKILEAHLGTANKILSRGDKSEKETKGP